MSSAKITLYGFTSYLKSAGDDLFKNLNVPEGIDRDTLIDNILLTGGEFEVLYSNPFFMQDAIKVWSNKWNRTITKWIEGLSIEFNPLHNYDRTEEWTETDSGTAYNKSNGTSTDNTTGATTNKVSAFNSNTFENDNQITTGTNGNTSMTNAGTEGHDNKNVKKGRAYGNIGVTTSTQMLEDFIRVEKWNLYEHVTDLFLSEFVLGIY